MSETITVPVTREAKVTLIGQVEVRHQAIVLTSREGSGLEPGDILAFRHTTSPGSSFRSGFARVHYVEGDLVVLCDRLHSTTPSACDHDLVYRVEPV